MKKSAFILMLCISLACCTTGCKGKVQSLKLSEIKDETVLLRSDGSVQSAAYEEFDKYYYDEKELEEYMEAVIEDYNERNGEKSVKLAKFDLEKVNGKNIAKAIFSYKDLATYCEMNGVAATTYTIEEAKAAGVLPTTFTNAADGTKIDQNAVTENSNYKVLVIQVKADIMLPDSVKYYSNAMLLNSNSVETTGEQTAVIVYK